MLVGPSFSSAGSRWCSRGADRFTRYTCISDMAQDGIAARTYGGMHSRGSSNATAAVGARIADYILANAARPVGDDSGSD